jgi:hypothetical protein
MSTPPTIQTDVPLVNVPFTDPKTGVVTETWFLFLIQLWRRTGGSGGVTPESLTIDDVLALETVFSLQNLAQSLQSLALEVQQLQALRRQPDDLGEMVLANG